VNTVVVSSQIRQARRSIKRDSLSAHTVKEELKIRLVSAPTEKECAGLGLKASGLGTSQRVIFS